MRKKYPTDLSEREWARIEKYFRVSYKKGGRPPRYSKREILNAILYILRTGCQWGYTIFHHGREYMNNLGGGRDREFLKK